MKHYFNILGPLCVIGLIALGIVALHKQGFVLFEFGDGKVVIDGR